VITTLLNLQDTITFPVAKGYFIMAVNLSAQQSTDVNEMLVNMIKTDEAKAIEFVEFSGRDHDDAVAYVTGIKQAIEVSEAKERLKGYCSGLQAAIKAAVDAYEAENPVDNTIVALKGEVKFSRAEVPDKPGEIIGFVVPDLKMQLVGEERMKSTGAKKGNGGGRSRVPLPQSLKDADVGSWKTHFANTYPEEHAKAEEGAAYSAPRKLEALKDPTYLEAKAASEATPAEAAETMGVFDAKGNQIQ
jgi:hypothetical protein